jgi:hypothetical protein
MIENTRRRHYNTSIIHAVLKKPINLQELCPLCGVNFINYITASREKCLGLTANITFMFWFCWSLPRDNPVPQAGVCT